MNYKQILLGARTVGIKGLYLAKKYKPEIMMVASIVSGVACVLNVRKAAKKEQAILDQHNKNIIEAHELVKNNPNLTEKQGKRIICRVYVDTGAQLLKLYGPSVAFGIASGTFSIMGFLIQKQRTKNAVAALATAVAAQKKLMEDGKLPELPSTDAEDSSKEGESPDSKEEKGIPPRRKKFEILFDFASKLWYDPIAGKAGMSIADLQALNCYLNTLVQVQNREIITLNDIADALYTDRKLLDGRLRTSDEKTDTPRTWTWEEGQMWGFRRDPDGRFIDMLGISNLTTNIMNDILLRDKEMWLSMNAEYLGGGKKK